MAEIIGHIGRAQTLTAELSTPQTITGSLCGGAAHGITTGGEPGQGLIKVSDADYDVKWMDILPEDTASGSVASFPDGADDLPMSVVVDIDPVQDLHGYDSPWPAGGGANKWDGEWASGEISSSTGNESPSESSNYWYSVNYVPISDSNTYYIAGEASGKAIRVRFYDANKGYIGYAVASGQAYCGSTFVPPSGAAYMRFAPEKANFPNHSIAINYPSTVTTVTPYSNICPISGRTGAKVTRTGRNLVEDSLVGYNIIANGTFEQTSSFTMQIAQVKKGVQYTKTAGDDYFVGGYFTEKPTPSSVTYNNSRIVELANTFTAPIDGYVVFRTASSFATPQLELGSTAHAYEPYQGVTQEIPFSTEVYGGTLNVETGELVVDRAMVDLGTLNWTKISTTSHHWRFWVVFNALARNGEMLSSQYKHITASQQYVGEIGIASQSSDINYLVMVSDERFTDATTFKTAMNGVQLVYQLASPITLTLSAIEMRSLLGDNNVFADTGDVSVTYKADVQKYIDKKISAAVAAMS